MTLTLTFAGRNPLTFSNLTQAQINRDITFISINRDVDIEVSITVTN